MGMFWKVFYISEAESASRLKCGCLREPFSTLVVLLHQTRVNQVTRPGGSHERRTRAMLSRTWSTNEQLTCTGCFAYEPAKTAPVRTLRLTTSRWPRIEQLSEGRVNGPA
jgi:hypothetical protein